MKTLRSILLLACGVVLVSNASAQSVARTWDETLLSGIRIDLPNPPVNARNLFHLSVAMYDAWAAYDTNAVGYLFREKHTSDNIPAAQNAAVSYAAYRLLMERYAYSVGSNTTLPAIMAQMIALGYDTNNTSMDTSTPAGVGNAVYAAVSSYFINDGADELNGYADWPTNQGGYISVNAPLATGLPGDSNVTFINQWQPLAITNALSQNGIPLGPIQKFVGAQWLGVRPFALDRSSPSLPWIDPGPQPRLNGVGDTRFRTDVADIIQHSSDLTPDNGVTTNISPGSFGNNTLGANDGTGHPVNPFTGLPYAPNIVPLGDFGRVIAEYWADGPNSETPPGHWNVLANQVADNTNTVKRIGGVGPVVSGLEWDVKVYFALNAAVHEAACAAWGLKRYYNGGRPIEWVRWMGQAGQCSDPTSPSYSTNGLPLVTNLIELVTTNSAAPGGPHQGLPVGAVVINAWPGPPPNPATQHSGVKWMLPATWLPYQKATFVTPSFPGYISGHSTFSRAAAEVLAAITGSAFWPGGMNTFTAPSNSFLTFENGPSQTVQLQWGTYFDASDQSGISRTYGGIHVTVDDFTGRVTGSQCGQVVWALAKTYFDGSVTNAPIPLAIQSLQTNGCQLSYKTLRGFYYSLQSAPNPGPPFTNNIQAMFQATNASMVITDIVAATRRFYRVTSALQPE
jgi:hypothetical protein